MDDVPDYVLGDSFRLRQMILNLVGSPGFNSIAILAMGSTIESNSPMPHNNTRRGQPFDPEGVPGALF
jgi:hypothetical protein